MANGERKACHLAGDDVNHQKRPAVYGGPRSPRCATCERARKVAARQRAKETRVERVYGITPEEYDAILASQGGRCAVCQRATGKTRRLAVDHDHGHCAVCATGNACWQGVRCLACKTCNTFLLGRYGVAALIRAARVLLEHPAQTVLRNTRKDRLE